MARARRPNYKAAWPLRGCRCGDLFRTRDPSTPTPCCGDVAVMPREASRYRGVARRPRMAVGARGRGPTCGLPWPPRCADGSSWAQRWA